MARGLCHPPGVQQCPGYGVRQCRPVPQNAGWRLGGWGAAGPHPAPSPGAMAGGLPLVLLPAGARGQGGRWGQGQGRSRRWVGWGLLCRLGLHPHWPGALHVGAGSWAVPLRVTPLGPQGPPALLWPQTPAGSRRGFQRAVAPHGPQHPQPSTVYLCPHHGQHPMGRARCHNLTPSPAPPPRCPLPQHSPPHRGAPPAARGAAGTPSG